ncbi:hypothetical protein PybrP1_001187 [[Pythium] brassicae (nom. inval.)]|nr:hypothetical protein PybrP1_001187 [[Pythium] brassicae (nom. inval.)]
MDGNGSSADGVFYDVDAGSARGHSLLVPRTHRPLPSANPKATKVAASDSILRRPKTIFPTAMLLQLDASDGDDHAAASDDENPFASLLQAPPPRAAALSDDDDELLSASPLDTSFLPQGKRQQATELDGAKQHGRVFKTHEHRGSRGAAITVEPAVDHGAEAASSCNPAVGGREACAEEQRATSASSDEGEGGDALSALKKPRLADVLMRATLLSQQKAQDGRFDPQRRISTQSVLAAESEDAIADTAEQLRQEKFEADVLSPSALAHPPARRKLKPDAAAAKIRCGLGEPVARAIRATARDLTLLHSHGQTLLSGFGSADLERVQDRDFAVVRLRRQRRCADHADEAEVLTTFDGRVHALSRGPGDSGPPAHARVRVAFSAQAAARLSLQPDTLVKVYAPFHFVPLEHAVGTAAVRRKPQWLLIGTTLSEMAA